MESRREKSVHVSPQWRLSPRTVTRLVRRLTHISAVACSVLLGVTPAGAEDLISQRAASLGIPSQLPVVDVRLAADHSFTGCVRTPQSRPLAGISVQLETPPATAAEWTTTDEKGRFVFTGLSTGLVRIHCGGTVQYVRVWSEETAPPSARGHLDLAILPSAVLRGQQPLGNLFCNEPIMIGVLVAAAIAIPLALHESGDQADGS